MAEIPGAPGSSTSLVQRIKSLIMKPLETWPAIAAERDTPGDLFVRLAVPLAAIGPVCQFLHGQLFGYGALGISYSPSLVGGIATMVVSYLLALVSVVVLGLVADWLAPKFEGEASRAAALLGLGGERAAFDARFAEMLGRFQKAFYRDGSYAGGSQTALAMPLAMNLAPAESRAALAGRLVDAIRSRDNHTSAGDIGYRYVIQALLEAGRNDVIFDLASQPTKPSYAGQLAAGATSLTEAWDANPNSSQNHLMLGHIEQWFYAGLAGIRPVADSPGLTKIRIWPAPVGDVRWVKASWDSVRGPVNVDWRISGGRFHLSVDIPPGMTADVRLPGQAAATKGSGHYELECAAPGS